MKAVLKPDVMDQLEQLYQEAVIDGAREIERFEVTSAEMGLLMRKPVGRTSRDDPFGNRSLHRDGDNLVYRGIPIRIAD